VPSIRVRLARALLGWSVIWSIAVTSAVWLAVKHEVDELLDDTLQASAEVLGTLLSRGDFSRDSGTMSQVAGESSTRFAWQVVDSAAHVLLRSPQAPADPLSATPSAGFSGTADWRVFGMPLDADGRMLYVAQSEEERFEAQTEVALSSALAALAIALLGHLWLRARVRHELEPLQRLSMRLAGHEPFEDGATLGAAEREELQPMQSAIDELGQRLARRMAHERAFTAHAAHSLRTPLAGIDAQLAVALRESPPELAPRLRRVREAAGRLQRVVAALLALFRSGSAVKRHAVDVAALVSKLPVEGVSIEVVEPCRVEADPDLLSAALINLFDNALRYGARRVIVDAPQPGVLRLHDDGPGVADTRRQELQDALDRQQYESHMGLGLMLADLVARSHGGALTLPPTDAGFEVVLRVAIGVPRT
jgi:signal transduction histidine kinase